MLKEYNTVKNSDTPWMCYKDSTSNLIYFVHSKCACSFYKKLFVKLGWKIITQKEIDWDKNIVFSYIRDPLKKQRIGLIEWFYFNEKVKVLEQNANNLDFFIMLSCAVYLDFHSMSIYEHLGDRAKLVKWIPIDLPTVDHKQKTIELISQESHIDDIIKEWFLTLLPCHVTTGFKKECYNKLMQLPVHSLIVKSIDFDRCLYDDVTIEPGFEPDNYQDRIEQLEETGYTNTQAQEIADVEVANGQFLKWKN